MEGRLAGVGLAGRFRIPLVDPLSRPTRLMFLEIRPVLISRLDRQQAPVGIL